MWSLLHLQSFVTSFLAMGKRCAAGKRRSAVIRPERKAKSPSLTMQMVTDTIAIESLRKNKVQDGKNDD